MSKPSTEERIYALLDNSISPEELKELERCLLQDELARQKYHDILRIHNLLELEEEQQSASAFTPIVPIESLRKRQLRRRFIGSLGAAAAILVIAAMVLNYISLMDGQREGEIVFSKFSEYSLTNAKGEDVAAASGSLVVGSMIDLKQGCFSIELASGVEGVVEGPALMEITGENAVSLERGIAWFHVPDGAEGFVVRTPNIEAVDLGTKFVVETSATAASTDKLLVLEGSVEVKALLGAKSSGVLHEGEAVEVTYGGELSSYDSGSIYYLDSLPDHLVFNHWNFDQADQLQPKGNHPKVEQIDTALTEKLKVNVVKGIEGEAYQFSRDGGYMQTNWGGIDADRPRSISCWVKCSEHDPWGAIVEWGIPRSNSSKWRMSLNPETQGEGGVKGAIRTEFGHGYVIGSTDLRDGKWHHVVSVYDGSGVGNEQTIRLYVDGKLEAVSSSKTNKIRTVLDDTRSQDCVIGKDFDGVIDQLTIYDGVLPKSEILRQFKQYE
jgi:hypothetical protein